MPEDDYRLTCEDAAELLIEVEKVIEAIKNDELEGTYFEF